ncbi:MAG: hypothetical protein EBS01_09375 [Verrucomicrobia bacterium]|nr:hypothetical protein [Verrucomicrobiota bacterium]
MADHFRELFEGKQAHAYSAPAGSTPCDALLKRIDPDGSRKVLLAATSSTDERYAVEHSGIRPLHPPECYLFPSQLDWIQFLIEMASNSPELALIIRVHPREFPNKRESVLSSNAQRLKTLLINLPRNVIVNWPDDRISLYDLLQRVDLVLSAWSTVLMEASLFGCPIILPRNPVSYYEMMADSVCATTAEYGEAILTAVRNPWTIDRCVMTFRWFWLLQFGSNISLESKEFRRGRLKEYFHKGYKGGVKELRNRRIHFDGQGALTECLLGNLNPVEDYDTLQRLQKHYREASFGDPTPEERAAALDQIEALLALMNPGKRGILNYPSGRITQMIRTASL